MKQRTRKILLDILLFGLLLAVADILSSFIFSRLFTEKVDISEVQDALLVNMIVSQLLIIGLLFWGLVRIATRMTKPGYWWLVLIAFGILLVSYHCSYLYDVINYYVIRPMPKEPSGEDMEKYMEWAYAISENPPPAYNLVFYLIGNLLINLYYSLSSFNIGWLLFSLLTGIPVMPLWVSGFALFYSRKKKNRAQ